MFQHPQELLRFHPGPGSGQARRPFAALHMRDSDKATEDPNLEATQAALVAALDSVDPSWPILLLTDHAGCLARMRQRYGARLPTTDCQCTETKEGLHYLPDVDCVHAGREVLIDVCRRGRRRASSATARPMSRP